MRKIFAGLAVSFGMVSAVCGPISAFTLPDDIGEWRAVSTAVTPLITEYNHESQGSVTFRTYKRESPSAILDVILTEGAGTGKLYIPEKVNDSEGMMPCESGFELVKVSGHDAILESHPYMPLALAVMLGLDATLTIETASLSREQIIGFTENMIEYQTIP